MSFRISVLCTAGGFSLNPSQYIESRSWIQNTVWNRTTPIFSQRTHGYFKCITLDAEETVTAVDSLTERASVPEGYGGRMRSLKIRDTAREHVSSRSIRHMTKRLLSSCSQVQKRQLQYVLGKDLIHLLSDLCPLGRDLWQLFHLPVKLAISSFLGHFTAMDTLCKLRTDSLL